MTRTHCLEFLARSLPLAPAPMLRAVLLGALLSGCGAAAGDDETGAESRALGRGDVATPGATSPASSTAPAEGSDASSDDAPDPAAGNALLPDGEQTATVAAVSELPSSEAQEAPPPVQLVSAETDVGRGACAGVSVADVVQRVHKAQPELSDITRFALDPVFASLEEDGELPGPMESYYRAAITVDGQIVVGLRRCDGELVDFECSDESWWYFEADAACEPVATGEYRQVRRADCFETEGTPSVYFAAPLLERDVCGYDAQSLDLRGRYELMGYASGQLCPEAEDYGMATPLEVPLILEVDQDPNALRMASVTVHSEQFTCLDGWSFPAEVIGGQLIADSRYYNDGDSAECLPPARVTFSFGGQPPPFIGTLDFWRITNEPCGSAVPEYEPVSGFHFTSSSSSP